MKDRISISVSTINGSRFFYLGAKARQRIRWSIHLFLIASVLAAGITIYFIDKAGLFEVKQQELEQQADLLTEDLAEQKRLKAELEYDLTERDSQMSLVSERLGDIETVLGVPSDDNAALESRLDVAEINSAVRLAFLRYIPNGAPVKNARQSTQFGVRKHSETGSKRVHRGLDFAVNIGTPVYAPADGAVETVRSSKK